MRVKLLICLYLAVSLVTFAWSASDPAKACDPEKSRCIAVKEEIDRGIIGLMSGLLWPLYWSWEIAEKVRSPQP